VLTSPVPGRDGVMKMLEGVGVNRKRTSPHDCLVAFDTVPLVADNQTGIAKGLSPWGIVTRERE
jgi:hypothetical protein